MNAPEDGYQLLIENYPDGVVFLFEGRDPPRYTLVGGDGLDNVGLTKANLEGKPVANNRPADVREQVIAQYRRALDGEHVSFTTEVEGRTFRIRVMPVTDDDGTVTKGMGIAEDITEQETYRRRLERQNERLEAYSRLLSHDLKNPLTVAYGHLDAAARECDSGHLDEVEAALDTIESLAEDELPRAGGLSDDALSTVSLQAVATAAWQNVATGDARLQADEDCTIRADETRLRRLFENLFRNSVEHGSTNADDAAEDTPTDNGATDALRSDTAGGGSSTDGRPDDAAGVVVSVGALSDGFYVSDNGPGIPEAERNSVFDRGMTNSDTGTGLGLYIVNTVVEDHRWDVAVTESEQGGARFEITGVTRA